LALPLQPQLRLLQQFHPFRVIDATVLSAFLIYKSKNVSIPGFFFQKRINHLYENQIIPHRPRLYIFYDTHFGPGPPDSNATEQGAAISQGSGQASAAISSERAAAEQESGYTSAALASTKKPATSQSTKPAPAKQSSTYH
jgi:hypothetical protein